MTIILFKETNLRESPIGKMPKDWKAVTLESVAEINRESVDPAREFPDDEFIYVDIESIEGGSGVIGKAKKMAGKDAPSRARRIIHKNDVIMSTVRPYLKAFALVPDAYDGQICSTGFAVLTSKDEILPRFLLYTLFSNNVIGQCNAMMVGGQYPALNSSLVSKILIPLPPLEEQQKITEILSTVDQAIQKTNEVIAKTERLKKGLMQELLTKGIGHKEFKDTEIGRIPKDWEVKKLSDVVLEAKSGFACGERDENGILQLRMDNIETEGWINTEAGVKVPIPKNVEEYILKHGDILFNNTNSADLIGKTAIFKGEFSRCVYSNHLTRIRVNPKKVAPGWILYLFIRNWQMGIFKAIRHQHVHQAGINRGDLLGLKIPVASLEEQQKIAETLSTVDKKLETERDEKAKLEKIMQGLMDLLLTGKIRIKVN